MKPEQSPWIEVPENWLDDKYSRDYSYRAFQEYFGMKVKPRIINEYLVGKVVLPVTTIDVVRFYATESSGRLGIDATLGLTGNTRAGGRGTDTVEIYRTFNRASNECSFDKIGASSVSMRGFGVEYYRRAIPLLRRLGIEGLVTKPTTAAEESPIIFQFTGAYVWSFYGYTNENMAKTLEHYIDYIKKTRGLALPCAEEMKILNMDRMVDLAQDEQPNGEKTGKKFLCGMDTQDKPTLSYMWSGTHRNINDESPSNIEMIELTRYLLRKIKLLERTS